MRSYNDREGIVTYYMGSLSGLYPRGLQGLAIKPHKTQNLKMNLIGLKYLENIQEKI